MPRLELALVTCEHGGNRIPRAYASLFADAGTALRSHRGFDAGALEQARVLSRRFGVPLVASTTSRLLVDLNRTSNNPSVFSEFTRELSASDRERLLRDHHRPHWHEVDRVLRLRARRGGALLHVAAHSFVPVWKGRTRRVDVGFLHDPSRASEAAIARAWRRTLRRRCPTLAAYLNEPYRGWTDGLATSLRKRLPASRYAGIELEVNQRLTRSPKRWNALQRHIADSLHEALIDLAAS